MSTGTIVDLYGIHFQLAPYNDCHNEVAPAGRHVLRCSPGNGVQAVQGDRVHRLGEGTSGLFCQWQNTGRTELDDHYSLVS
ncbi:hypothetical protein [Streptomyces sp. SAI-129]|uniref:hypothetical protein n=1 Tax=Streptomyces sp. SAI-129 TaxID=3377727 RepID=UPI003C7E434E